MREIEIKRQRKERNIICRKRDSSERGKERERDTQ